MSQSLALVSQANLGFSFDIYKSIVATRKPDENVFLSPLTVLAALSMVDVGAQGSTRDEILKGTHFDGKTQDQINKAFQQEFAKLNIGQIPKNQPNGIITLSRNGGEPPVLKLANRVYANKGLVLKPDFTKTLETFYGSSLGVLDFVKNTTGAKKEVSRWVEEVTNGKIKNMGESLGSDTVLALISAIYFKAQWDTPFEPRDTKDGDFILANGDKVRVPFMHNTEKWSSKYAELKDFDAKGLMKPYTAAPINMFIILPNKKDGLAALEKKLSPALFDTKSYSGEDIEISLPKFKIEDKLDLKSVLESLGMKTMFTSAANFKGIADSTSLMVSKVIHKTFINVDEKGTEAAAATMVEMMAGACFMCTEPPPKIFNADHPFLFAIVHQDTNEVLFIGRVSHP